VFSYMEDKYSVAIESMEGMRAAFYGVCMSTFKLGDTVYQVVEDELDGWRSAMDHVRVRSPVADALYEYMLDPEPHFFATPLDDVTLRRPTGDEIWELVADDGHVWLRFGTANADDYYPWFVFEYEPRKATK